MQKLLNEWRQYLTEAKQFRKADTQKAIAKYKGSKITGTNLDLGGFLDNIARVESGYNPKAENGQYKGAFQLGKSFYGSSPNVAFNPYKAAKIAANFFMNRSPRVFEQNSEMYKVAKEKYGAGVCHYILYNQGATGGRRLLYVAVGMEDKIPKGYFEKTILPNMKGQGIGIIKPFLDNAVIGNQVKADAFVRYFENKFNF